MKTIQTNNAPNPIGPYSQGIVSGGFLYTAGQVGLDPPTGKIVDGGVREQTRRVMENLKAILEKANSSFDKVVKTTVYLKEPGMFKEMNEVYASFFKDHKPARSTVVCGFMREEVLVEIDVIAQV